MMRFSIVTALVLLSGSAHAAELAIVTTLPDLAAIAKEIGGDHVSVEALATPNQDPHYVDPRPNFIIKLNRASLVIVNGLGLEVGWLPNLLNNARNSAVQVGGPGFLDVSGFVDRMQVSTTRIDRSMGDLHPGGNPHFLFDPRQAIKVSRAIAERLAKLDPAHAAAFRQNRDAFAKELRPVIESEALRFAGLTEEQRRVVVYHQSLPYLLDWLGLTQVATIEARAGIPPSPGHVAAVLVTMRESKIKLIVQEGYYQTGPSETLAQLAKARLYVFPGGTDVRNKERYVERIKKLAKGLYDSIAR